MLICDVTHLDHCHRTRKGSKRNRPGAEQYALTGHRVHREINLTNPAHPIRAEVQIRHRGSEGDEFRNAFARHALRDDGAFVATSMQDPTELAQVSDAA